MIEKCLNFSALRVPMGDEEAVIFDVYEGGRKCKKCGRTRSYKGKS